jgi:NAD-dependent deacetylase
MKESSETLDNVRNLVENADKIVFFTGAGISKESGIPTFRGEEGLWKKYDPTRLASFSAFIAEPKLVWEFFYSRQRLVCQANYNEGHKAIAVVEAKRPGICSVLTQNIDRLHQRAGSKDVVELHGNIFGVVCKECGFEEQLDHTDFFTRFNESSIPTCSVCGNIMKPSVVLFEESLPVNEWQYAIHLSANCDLMFIVGSSLNVSPANTLPYYALRNKAILIEVNPNETEMTYLMNYSFRGSASDVLPKLLM